jgi:hypothetical protein
MAMDEQEKTAFVRALMTEFAERTGLIGGSAPTRYLWTDAFAVCNFLELERRTGSGTYAELAMCLVDQVHKVLGRHRADDPRTGWISGLDEDEGAQHPTAGGLRIGKPLGERPPGEPMDERVEWDRDGQYFHYLTRWMHALSRVSRVTGDPRYLRWAVELAVSAYQRFSYVADPEGHRRMYWKMSIDLSRPQVDAMGQHDPLDGLVTCLELRGAAKEQGQAVPEDLSAAIPDLEVMSKGLRLATSDPLGVGGLLTAAHTLVQLRLAGTTALEIPPGPLLDQALPGLQHQAANRSALAMPPEYRLAFRELGLSIGLRAVQRMQELVARSPRVFDARPPLSSRLDLLMRYAPLIEAIEGFWLEPENRAGDGWSEHEDINEVMLATSLAPEGYLAL